MEKNFILVSEGFGHGFMCVNFGVAEGLKPVAYSEKDSKEEFEAQVEQIYNNLVFFCPELQKATWEEREMYREAGWNVRQDLLDGKISPEQWQKFANAVLEPSENEELPQFDSLSAEGENTMFVPQKLISDGKCGVSAAEQSVSLDVFDFLKAETYGQLVLGQHFHKVNDLDKVKEIVKDFDAYVAGMTEHPEVFGIRGVSHKMYWKLYQKIAACVGIAGTHTWYLLTCFPYIPQVILYNKKTVEKWGEIEAAYRDAGYVITCLGYDENTDMKEFAKEVEEAYRNL